MSIDLPLSSSVDNFASKKYFCCPIYTSSHILSKNF